MNQVNNISKIDQENKPVIIIESGQRSGADTTNLALVLMQQLVACNEYNDLTIRAKWVILPSVNPDGLEYSVYVSTTLVKKPIFEVCKIKNENHLTNQLGKVYY